MAVQLPALSPAMTFDEACRAVVAYLKLAIPMGYWSVSRYDGDRQVYLTVSDDSYGTVDGDSHAWSDSFCQHMAVSAAPQVAPDAMAVPLYAAAGVAQTLTIRAYIGIPIQRADGQLFGTICGLDPEVKTESLAAHAPLLSLLSSLLATVLAADELQVEAARAVERACTEAETDALTGLLNRRGWERLIEVEEARWRRFGDPGSLIVLDIDRLKELNDAHGHSAGDRHLQRTAEVLRRVLRQSDIAARLGGDEFGIVVSASTPAACRQLVARLQVELDDAGISGSLGVAPYTIAHGFPGAWAAADAAMYAEKARRRDQVAANPAA